MKINQRLQRVVAQLAAQTTKAEKHTAAWFVHDLADAIPDCPRDDWRGECSLCADYARPIVSADLRATVRGWTIKAWATEAGASVEFQHWRRWAVVTRETQPNGVEYAIAAAIRDCVDDGVLADLFISFPCLTRFAP